MKIKVMKKAVVISTSETSRLINKTALPIRYKIKAGTFEKRVISKQAFRDSRAYFDKEMIEPLSFQVIQLAVENPTNGKNGYSIGMETYWAGYARGVREHRQKIKETTQSAFDVISSEDITELSHELGISEDKITFAVLEVISKRKNGGKA